MTSQIKLKIIANVFYDWNGRRMSCQALETKFYLLTCAECFLNEVWLRLEEYQFSGWEQTLIIKVGHHVLVILDTFQNVRQCFYVQLLTLTTDLRHLKPQTVIQSGILLVSLVLTTLYVLDCSNRDIICVCQNVVLLNDKIFSLLDCIVNHDDFALHQLQSHIRDATRVIF